MTMLKRAIVLASLMLAAAGATPAFDAKTVANNVPFTTAFSNDTNGQYFGAMRLSFNKGAISGTYNDEAPESGNPLANQHGVAVSGSIQASGKSALTIGALRASGQWHGQQFKGTATMATGPYKGVHYTIQIDFAE